MAPPNLRLKFDNKQTNKFFRFYILRGTHDDCALYAACNGITPLLPLYNTKSFCAYYGNACLASTASQQRL